MARSIGGRGRRVAIAAMMGMAAASGGVVLSVTTPGGTAFADSSPYELYCPNTPVGNIVLNDVKTSGTITPASPSAGGTFNVTNYQTIANVPTSLASASAALGNSTLSGSATATIDATGATPASIASPPISFSSPLSSPIPASGITLNLPSPPSSIGPFTASGGAITVKEDSAAKLTLQVSGSPLTLTCTAYANNTAPTGITTAAPTGSPLSPTIATATASGGAAPTTTPTTAPATAPSTGAATATPSTTALTGPGPHLWLLAAVGGALLCLGFATLVFGGTPLARWRRSLRPAGGAPSVVDLGEDATRSTGLGLWIEETSPTGTPAGDPEGLWITGWEPEGTS